MSYERLYVKRAEDRHGRGGLAIATAAEKVDALRITHGGFTTVMDRQGCVFSSSRVGTGQWIEGVFVSHEAVEDADDL